MSILEKAGDELHVDTSEIEKNSHAALEEHIRDTAEAYIEKKAKELGAAVQAKVTLTKEEYPVPLSARIIGSLSAQQQLALSNYMCHEMGIEVTRQEWELYG